jgi:hypothetical protein
MNGKVEISYSGNPVGMSETGKVPHQRHRTQMTRIARIFTDMWSSVPSVKSLNAPQSAQSIDARIFASFMLWHEKINNELIRTIYELTLPEFVSVRISSLFSIFFSFQSRR